MVIIEVIAVVVVLLVELISLKLKKNRSSKGERRYNNTDINAHRHPTRSALRDVHSPSFGASYEGNWATTFSGCEEVGVTGPPKPLESDRRGVPPAAESSGAGPLEWDRYLLKASEGGPAAVESLAVLCDLLKSIPLVIRVVWQWWRDEV